jgi:O-antigen/teichoic acid export membrane protein
VTALPTPAAPSPGHVLFANTVARNSAWGLGAQLAIKILSFAFSVLVLRHLGAEEYGQYAGVLAFGGLFVFLADLGISQYVVREIARQRNTPGGEQLAESLYASALSLRLLLSLFAATLVVSAAWLTGRPPAMVGAIALGTLGLIMYAVQGTSDAVLGGYERLDLSSAAKIVNQFIFVLVGGVALWFGFGYYGLVMANLLGVAAITFLCWRSVRRLGLRPGSINFAQWPSIVRASVPFGVIGFTLGLSYKFDSVLLNVTRSNLETGYYNAAYNLVFSAAIISNVFNTALFPSLTRRAARSSDSLNQVYDRSLRYLLVAGLPIAVGTCMVADQLIVALYTTDYLAVVPALQVVIWAVPLMFLSEFLGYTAAVQNKERRVARAVLVSTSLNIVVNVLLIPPFGFLAAAIMTVVTEAVLVSQYVWMLRSTLRQLNWKRSLSGSLCAAAAMAGVLAIAHPLSLLVEIGLGIFTYGLMLLILRMIGPEELLSIKSLRIAPSEPIAVAAPPDEAAVAA